jgi:hypothetical protein
MPMLSVASSNLYMLYMDFLSLMGARLDFQTFSKICSYF